MNFRGQYTYKAPHWTTALRQAAHQAIHGTLHHTKPSFNADPHGWIKWHEKRYPVGSYVESRAQTSAHGRGETGRITRSHWEPGVGAWLMTTEWGHGANLSVELNWFYPYRILQIERFYWPIVNGKAVDPNLVDPQLVPNGPPHDLADCLRRRMSDILGDQLAGEVANNVAQVVAFGDVGEPVERLVRDALEHRMRHQKVYRAEHLTPALVDRAAAAVAGERMTTNAVHATHHVGGVLTDPKELLKKAGLSRDADRLRKLQAKAASAYEAGRLAEGDRLAARADVLVEKIDTALTELEEEGEEQQEAPVRSVTKAFAEAWAQCMEDPWGTTCRDKVDAFRRTGHGEWQPPSKVFVGPTRMWGKSDPQQRPEWYEERAGYYELPGLVHQLRDIVGDQSADPMALLDAAEDAYLSQEALRRRIRAGAEERRITGRDPLKEAKRFIHTTRRRQSKRRVTGMR